MPGDDLLFHRLSDSTIGAVWFHGRVRDGIGWFTDAMATRQWSLWGLYEGFKSIAVHKVYREIYPPVSDIAGVFVHRCDVARADGDGANSSSANRAISIG